MTYNIKKLHLKRGASIVVNVLKEHPDKYEVVIFDVQNCPFNIWKNQDKAVIDKSLLKNF